MSEPVRPDFQGACVSNLVPAVLKRSGGAPDWLPQSARDAETVIVLVLDGIGWMEFQKHRDELPVFAAMDAKPITSVAPSTTATVLTSITTGAAPAKHGLLGFRMRDGDRTLNVLRWQVSPDGELPKPKLIQPVAPFLSKSVPVVSRSHFNGTGFSEAHMRGVRYFGWFTTSTLVERCRQLARAREPFVYAYYDGVDHVAHVRGLNDSFYDVELAFADRLVGELLDVLPEHAALVVTADHGQVHLGQNEWTALPDEILELVDAHAGDARFRYLHAVRGAEADLLAAAREQLSARAWVFGREELATNGLLGEETPTEEVALRIGDVVLAAHDPIAFIDPGFPEEVRLRSGHGSLTEAEMLVPLLVACGRAA